jgi:hypothetical protein
MATEPSNQQLLRDEGVIKTDDLPQRYADVIDGLSRHEVDTIVAVKNRLKAADRDTDHDAGEFLFPP